MDRQWWEKRQWLMHLVAALGYAIVYAIHTTLYPFMDGHSYYIGGLRVAFLLLAPYRYWPALIVTDIGCRGVVLTDNLYEWGSAWFVTTLISGMASAAPVVWWCRERLSLFPAKKLVNFQSLLVCAVLVSLVWTLVDLLSRCLAIPVPGQTWAPLNWYWVLDAFVSFYIQLLAITPWVLMVRAELQSDMPLRHRLREFSRQLFAADTLLLLLSGTLFLIWLIHNNQGDAQHLSLMAVFLPIVWLLFKPGWRAAALGGTPALIYIGSLVQGVYEVHSFEAKSFLALSISCLLALGARLAAKRHHDERERFKAEQAMHMARQSIHLGEMRMRKTAQALELAGNALHLTHHQLLDRFHDIIPPNEAQRYYRQAAATQNQVSRLADSMHPSAWRHHGLTAALRETIAEALRETGIAYRCDIKGDSLHGISPLMHAAIYRLACETVAYVNAQICSSINLTLRTGVNKGIYWAALRVSGVLEDAPVNDAVYDLNERDYLASKLGAHGLGFVALRNHARLFAGDVHQRSTSSGLCLTYLLIDAVERPFESVAHPSAIHPWVT
jgi:glucose-6-phosphate-specific signal transduction histidine kinase